MITIHCQYLERLGYIYYRNVLHINNFIQVYKWVSGFDEIEGVEHLEMTLPKVDLVGRRGWHRAIVRKIEQHFGMFIYFVERNRTIFDYIRKLVQQKACKVEESTKILFIEVGRTNGRDRTRPANKK